METSVIAKNINYLGSSGNICYYKIKLNIWERVGTSVTAKQS